MKFGVNEKSFNFLAGPHLDELVVKLATENCISVVELIL